MPPGRRLSISDVAGMSFTPQTAASPRICGTGSPRSCESIERSSSRLPRSKQIRRGSMLPARWPPGLSASSCTGRGRCMTRTTLGSRVGSLLIRSSRNQYRRGSRRFPPPDPSADSAERTRAQLAKGSAAIAELLQRFEAALERSSTSGVHVSPVFNRRTPTKITGYQCTFPTQIVVTDLESLSRFV